MTESKCPDCEISGTQYIISTESNEKTGAHPDYRDAMFHIAYCSKCGYVYGVFNKIFHPPSIPDLRDMGKNQNL